MTWRRSSKPPGWYPRRGDVCLFALDKERPAVVISTDALNRFALDICVVPISSVEHKRFSLRPKIAAGTGGLQKESWAKCDRVTTLEKAAAVYPPLGRLSNEVMQSLGRAVITALELTERQ
jgi:mRNA-degrading endonuclease toxin of MazEF toxin-antitoxin module